MTPNMYRIGDYVYFESSSSSPYQVRRIEELNKTANGSVEAKVMCFYRRRDVTSTLMTLADKHQASVEEEQKEIGRYRTLDEKERHFLEHRELFLSRQMETLPATHIRGKCSVTLLNEAEDLLGYTNKEDVFFYSLVYDPNQKTLLADKGEIRVGQRYQADSLPEPSCIDDRKTSDMEELVWEPDQISEPMVQKFITMARSVGTFARALDCSSSVRQPSLHMSAAAASRDITLFHAMSALHKSKYHVTVALSALVTDEGPILCRDEIEEWSPSETSMFEEALEKYGKDFNDIRQDFLPWKQLKSIIEYYYMWKTTDKYVQQKRIKALDTESKLKQVYIPNYNKANPNQLTGKMGLSAQIGSTVGPRPCEGCRRVDAERWYAWGPTHMQSRLCSVCWAYWKKYGGLQDANARMGEISETQTHTVDMNDRPPPSMRKERAMQYVAGGGSAGISGAVSGAYTAAPAGSHVCSYTNCGKEFRHKTNLLRHLAQAHGVHVGGRSGSPRPMMKTRAAFCLITTPLTRLARSVCKDLLKPRHASRNPTIALETAIIKQECQVRLPQSQSGITIKYKAPVRKIINQVMEGLGVDIKLPDPALLSKEGTGKHPLKLAFPKPLTMAPLPSTIAAKRTYSQALGTRRGFKGDPVAKRPNLEGRGDGDNQLSSGGRGAKPRRATAESAPADIFFKADPNIKTSRKSLASKELKHMARSPAYTAAMEGQLAELATAGLQVAISAATTATDTATVKATATYTIEPKPSSEPETNGVESAKDSGITLPDNEIETAAVPATAVPATAVPATAVPATAVPATAVPATAVPTDSEKDKDGDVVMVE